MVAHRAQPRADDLQPFMRSWSPYRPALRRRVFRRNLRAATAGLVARPPPPWALASMATNSQVSARRTLGNPARTCRSDALCGRLKDRHALHVARYRKHAHRKHVKENRRSVTRRAKSGLEIDVHRGRYGHYVRSHDAHSSRAQAAPGAKCQISAGKSACWSPRVGSSGTRHPGPP